MEENLVMLNPAKRTRKYAQNEVLFLSKPHYFPCAAAGILTIPRRWTVGQLTTYVELHHSPGGQGHETPAAAEKVLRPNPKTKASRDTILTKMFM